MPTFHIHIKGQVQGVGFRPFVYNLARSLGLKGWVNNTLDGVHIRFNAHLEEATHFYQQVQKDAPSLAVITSHKLMNVADENFDQFSIIHSAKDGLPNLLLTPDFATCSDCRKELLTPQNRRYRYPFITCTNCGPRYSIITDLPYDRESTTMSGFLLCKICSEEYQNPGNRRYYSQTNSCSSCGIQLSLFDNAANLLTSDTAKALTQTIEAIKAGHIVAIKGIGGFLIIADATNPKTTALLRKRKHRPRKPFAVLYPDLESLQKEVIIDQKAIGKLLSPAAPIILLTAKKHLPSGLDIKGVAPGLQQLGVMLPYTPLYELLLQNLKRPLIATSGNVSGTPIVFRDKNALKELPLIADYLLLNNRNIAIPQDDSVVRYTEKEKHLIIVRRSRGIAPTHLELNMDWPTDSILSMGALLKSSFTLLHQQNSYISQYLGKLNYLETQENYRHTLDYFLNLFKAEVDQIIVDEHPSYYSTQLGKELADNWSIPIHKVQHHKAHFGAVLAENSLLDSETPVLGVIWDGTGLGSDGQIWGGAFFNFENQTMTRFGHLAYFPWILNDKMALEPRISALAACWNIPEAKSLLKIKFTSQEWRIYQGIINKPTLQTSSIGRLFDAVSAILGLIDKNTYEGQAAMFLEQLAKKYPEKFAMDWSESYLYGFPFESEIPTTILLENLIEDIQNQVPKEKIAARFHFSLIHSIHEIKMNYKFKKIAFSGGVWQNTLLVDMAIHYLSKDASLYFHRQLSPNDECISYGGLVCWLLEKKKSEKNLSNH